MRRAFYLTFGKDMLHDKEEEDQLKILIRGEK